MVHRTSTCADAWCRSEKYVRVVRRRLAIQRGLGAFRAIGTFIALRRTAIIKLCIILCLLFGLCGDLFVYCKSTKWGIIPQLEPRPRSVSLSISIFLTGDCCNPVQLQTDYSRFAHLETALAKHNSAARQALTRLDVLGPCSHILAPKAYVATTGCVFDLDSILSAHPHSRRLLNEVAAEQKLADQFQSRKQHPGWAEFTYWPKFVQTRKWNINYILSTGRDRRPVDNSLIIEWRRTIIGFRVSIANINRTQHWTDLVRRLQFIGD